MFRSKFQMQMEELNKGLVHMGTMVEQAIKDSVEALSTQNSDLCAKVITAEKDIDNMRNEIESKALKILLMQQPVASDLRKITTALKLISDMERIGDQARDICDIVLSLCEEEYQITLEIIPQMGELAKKMVKESIDAFVNEDLDKAKQVISDDDKMDKLFSELKIKMVKLLKKKVDAADQAVYFLMVGKYLEKIGDHAENIANWVIFSKLGEHKHIKLL